MPTEFERHDSGIDEWGRYVLRFQRWDGGPELELRLSANAPWDEFLEMLRMFALAVGYAPKSVEEVFG